MQSGNALRVLNATGAGKITHIVYIVQENRSFNNMFYGYPGAYTVTEGKNSKGQTIKLKPSKLGAYYDIDHSVAGDDRGMQRYGHAARYGLPDERIRPRVDRRASFKNPQYVYVPHDQSKPYFDMAHEGALADRMFQSQLDESFVAHQYVIAAQAAWSADLPDGYWGCEEHEQAEVPMITNERVVTGYQKACFDYQTLGDELDKAKLSWRFYASQYGSGSSGNGGTWSSYQAIKHIYNGPDWKKDVISPNWKFITDVRKGELANFTWITPVCDDSDHTNCPDDYGPSWVSALVNTVGEEQVLELDGDLHPVGRLGRPLRPGGAGVQGSRQLRLPRSADHAISVRHTRSRLARSLRNRQRAALRRRSVWSRSAGAGRQARDLAGSRLLRLFAEADQVRSDQGAFAAEVFHAPVPDDYLIPDSE